MTSGSVQPGLQRWAREFMRTVDTRDAEAIGAKLTDDVAFTIGNHPTVTGRGNVVELFAATSARFADMWHDIAAIWHGSDHTGLLPLEVASIEGFANYVMHDGRTIRLPVTSTLRIRDNHVADYRVYMDPNPAFGD